MATKNGRKPWANYRITADVVGEVVRGAADATQANMSPYRLVQYTADDYRIRGGWPEPVPRFDVRASASVSCGGVVTSDRPAPIDVETNATARWIAGVNFDAGAGEWHPAQGPASYELYSGYPETMPTLVEDLPYRVHKEQILRDALIFQAQNMNYLASTSIPATDEFTLLFVLSVNESLNTIDDDVVDEEVAGLVAPETVGPWNPSMQMRSGKLSIQVHPDRAFESRPGSSLFNVKALAQPFYMSFQVGKPGVRSWFGKDPKNLKGFRVQYPYDDHPQSTNFVIGVDSGFEFYANMSLFDLSYYDHRLDRFAVAREFKKLAKSYGGK